MKLRVIALTAALLLSAAHAWAFPDSSVVETCTGADGTSPPSANMTNTIIYGSSSATIKIIGNTCTTGTTATEGDAYYNVSSFTDSEAYVKIASNQNWNYITVCVRLQQLGASTTDGYCIYAGRVTSDLTLERTTNGGTGATLRTDTSITWAVGDQFGLSAVGTSICAYRKPVAGSWTQLGCATDSIYAGPGRIGIVTDGDSNVGVWDDFGGGAVAGAGTRAGRGSLPYFFN